MRNDRREPSAGKIMKRRQQRNAAGRLRFLESDGNQQKIFIARWLNTDAELLLLDNPTQGIDVGAKAEIYRLILELARAGKTILINNAIKGIILILVILVQVAGPQIREKFRKTA